MMQSNYNTVAGVNVVDTLSARSEGYNMYREKWKKNPADGTVGEFPLFLDIEVSSVCNLLCPFCVQTNTQFKKGFMPMSLFKKIIDEAAANGCYGCKFHTIGRGEPLLHNNITEMVWYAKKKGLIDVYLNTNAVLLTRNISIALLDAGIDRVSFSVEGTNRTEYERKRVGSDFGMVSMNIMRFKRLRDAGYYTTRIRIQAVETRDFNEEKYGKLWAPYCDEVGYVTYKNMHGRRMGAVKRDWYCEQLWQRMSVLFDGTILPCNHDDRLYAALGTYTKGFTIIDAWNSLAMKFMREVHRVGLSHYFGACDGCYLRESLG